MLKKVAIAALTGILLSVFPTISAHARPAGPLLERALIKGVFPGGAPPLGTPEANTLTEACRTNNPGLFAIPYLRANSTEARTQFVKDNFKDQMKVAWFSNEEFTQAGFDYQLEFDSASPYNNQVITNDSLFIVEVVSDLGGGVTNYYCFAVTVQDPIGVTSTYSHYFDAPYFSEIPVPISQIGLLNPPTLKATYGSDLGTPDEGTLIDVPPVESNLYSDDCEVTNYVDALDCLQTIGHEVSLDYIVDDGATMVTSTLKFRSIADAPIIDQTYVGDSQPIVDGASSPEVTINFDWSTGYRFDTYIDEIYSRSPYDPNDPGNLFVIDLGGQTSLTVARIRATSDNDVHIYFSGTAQGPDIITIRANQSAFLPNTGNPEITQTNLLEIEVFGAEETPPCYIELFGVLTNGSSCTGSVTIDDSVTSIGDAAFYGNTALTSVTIPDSVTSIGSEAFYNNTTLISVIIGDSVTSIGNFAFYNNTSLTSVTIPDFVTSIGSEAFYNNTALISVIIGDSVISIGSSAFENTALTSVIIPELVTSIGEDAFRNTALTSATIGSSVTSIGSSAFENTALTSITIGSSVTTIGIGAFSNNDLTSVTIPDSVTSIGDAAFYFNTLLTSVTFLGNAPTVGVNAFFDLSSGATANVSHTASGFSPPGQLWNGLIVRSSTSATYSATTLAEAADNDGSITTTITITLSSETFSAAEDNFTARTTNFPAGLTAVLTVGTDRTYATLSFTGTASSHANADDISNLTITFVSGDFESGILPSGANRSDLAINFDDPADPADSTAPTPSSSLPADDATGVGITSNIVLTFSESVFAGTGNIKLRRSSDGSNVEIFNVATATNVTGWGTTTITINPSANLLNSTGYYLLITIDAIKDASENFYAGLSGASTLNFTTASNAASSAAITTQPSGATSGEVFTTQPVIRIVDADDNTVTSFTGNVTVGIASGTGTLGGTTTVAAVAGVATFTDLGILGLGAFTLIFTSESLSSITSESVNLSGGGLSSDATLSSLTLSLTTALTPTFVSGTSTYTASVSNATTSVTVTPIKSQANATIKVKVNSGSYATVISGSASSSLSLNVGSNTIYVEVTAEDATTILTYTITVTRAVAVAASGAIEYEIVYKSNTVDNTSVQQDPRGYYKSGTTITVLTQEPSRRGYTFLIWNNKADGTGTSYKPGSKFDITKNITLFAQWKINQYTLSYSVNGGPALTLASKTQDYGSYIKVLSVPESSMRTGYSFTAWNTKADGTGVSYVPTDIFVVDVADTTLFAQWKINTYTITFSTNGGPELKLDAITLEYGASVKVPSLSDASLRTGYSFMGWNIKSDGTGTSYLPASAFTMATSNTTFFAQWKINQYTISFSANGGPELKLESITQDYASVVKLPALPVESMRTGYTFIGWNTKNDGLGTSYGAAENFTLGAANTVLFTNWKINQYTISYDANGNNIGRAPALSSQDFNSTVVVAAPSRVFVRSGYSFIGWSKAKDGSGKLYQIGDAFTLGAGNELFYAAWKPNTYKVTFLNTTKDVLPTATFQTGGLITSAPTPPARPGYSFMGWSSRASKTDIITLPYSPGVVKNITLYAVWVRTK